MYVLTYPQWKLNRQIVIGVVAIVLIVAAIVWWKHADAKKQPAEV
jgi:glucose uptake protein GlcU